ncbi:MAG: S53 family peptidase [Acidimicrobiales bacterium]
MKLSVGRAAIAVTLVAGLALVASPALASASPRTTLSGSQPAWATASHAVGRVSGSTTRSFQVNLDLRDAAAATRLASEVSNPKSALYEHYLTPAQFNARFSPTAKQVGAIEKWLRSSGFHVTGVPSNNRYVAASGTVAKIDQAFGTTLEWYAIKGGRYVAPATALSTPASVGRDILAVVGLDDGALMTRPDDVSAAVKPSAPGTGSKQVDCSHYYGQHQAHMPKAYGLNKFPTYICGYTATQLEGAYGVSSAIASGNDGTGVTVAITDAYASPTIVADANAFSRQEGIPGFKPGQLNQILPSKFDDQRLCGDWSVEETIDIEAVHTIAPGATINYVGGENCGAGLFDALNKVVAHHLADQVTDSWSNGGENLPPNHIAAEQAIFVQGAAEGIGFGFSSGDDGDLLTQTGETQPSFPGSDPWVTAVGGTSLALGKADNYISETGWGNDIAQATGSPAYSPALPGFFYAGAGGGPSHVFAEPAYQDGVVPTSLSDTYGSPTRVVPDVSALADPFTGFSIVITSDGVQQHQTWGGTSLASPLFAGMLALADQYRSAPIGFANPLLYSEAGTDAFHDVTPSLKAIALVFSEGPGLNFLVTQDHDTSLSVTAGYDDVTGIGTPNGSAFLSTFG